MTSSSGQEIEKNDNAYIEWLMYKLLNSSDALSIGFLRDSQFLFTICINNNKAKWNCQVIFNLRHFFFGSAEKQENTTYGFG